MDLQRLKKMEESLLRFERKKNNNVVMQKAILAIADALDVIAGEI
jgi:hypothetical protein